MFGVNRMEALSVGDLWEDALFYQKRPELLLEILELKKRRRVALGPFMTILFESRSLVWWQVQEMLRVEKGGREQIAEELDTYNPLIPNPNRLTFTLMIELVDHRKETLAKLVDIEKFLTLTFGIYTVRAVPIAFRNEYIPSRNKTSSVHFLQFPFSKEERESFCTCLLPPRLDCVHPEAFFQQPISSTLWKILQEERKIG